MNRIAMTTIAESRDDRANNVDAGLALNSINRPTSGSIRVTLRPWEGGQDRLVQNTRVLQSRLDGPQTSLVGGVPIGIGDHPQRLRPDAWPDR